VKSRCRGFVKRKGKREGARGSSGEDGRGRIKKKSLEQTEEYREEVCVIIGALSMLLKKVNETGGDPEAG